MGSPKRRFSQHEEDQLIEFVKSNSFLWDKNNSEYRNIKLRDKTWKKFAKTMNINTKICIHRWYNMRDYFKCKRKTSSTGHVRRREEKLAFLNEDTSSLHPARDIEMVTTNAADFLGVPKSEINSLEYEGGGSNDDDRSQSPTSNFDYGSATSAKQPSEDDYAALDELLLEKHNESQESKLRRTVGVPVTSLVTQQTAQGHSLDIFFQAMCATVKTFPNADMAEIKLKISHIVGTKEIEIMNRVQN